MNPVAGAYKALEYGWAVIQVWGVDTEGICMCPAGPTCKSAGKHPVASRWRAATMSRAQVASKETARTNWGITTGPASGVWVLDVDASSGGLETLEQLEAEYGKLPSTFEVATGGGGKHFYWKCNDAYDVRNSAGTVGKGLDTRGDGGFVVLPGSLSSKGEYRTVQDIPPVEAPSWLYGLLAQRRKSRPVEDLIEGSRNNTLASVAGRLRRDGASEGQIATALKRINATASQPLDEDEVEKIAASISTYEPEPILRSLSDTGNLERFVDRVGEFVRHSYELGWIAWDGKRWARNEKLVHEHARSIHEVIRNEAPAAKTDKEMKAIEEWAGKSMSRSRIEAIVAMAEKDPRLDVVVEDLDSHPWLFNAGNGTVDLKTGALMRHDPNHLLTKVSPTRYNPAAKCPTWEWFLLDIFNGDKELVSFMQRSAGILLSGDTSEHTLWFLYGHGRNGKSVMVETLLKVLGKDYATEAAIGLLETKQAQGHTTDIAEIRGIRFLTANETQEGKRMDEARVKQLTGGDTLKGRHMRQDNISFLPTHKLWLRGNHKPRIYDTTVSIWDRMALVPFRRSYTDKEQDTLLPKKLQAEAEGILAWMVRGCLDWQQNGLGRPKAVVEATQEYRSEMDPLGAFLEDVCEVNPKATVTKADLFSRYVTWAAVNNERSVSQRDFTRALRERGFEEVRTASTRSWQGITVARSPELHQG